MGELTCLGSSGGPQLALDEIVGNSAKNPRQFHLQDDLIAYTASGGVIVSEINTKTGQIVSQRFFCANSSYHGSNSTSSANAYLNMAFDIAEDTEVIKDQYGYPVNSDPTVVTGASGSTYGDPEFFSPGNENDGASPSKLKDRVRSIHCITISPNKRLLAIGESGYQPRILIYSLAPDSSKNPIILIYEHSFGINSVSFSPDSRYLCSLGFINDGFINVWKVNLTSASLHSSNKCSAPINLVIWHENFIITMGLRLIKVWKFDIPDQDSSAVSKPSVLKGKNVLLGNLINSNFIHGSILNSDELLITTSTNNLLLLKLNYESLSLITLDTPQFTFSTVLVDYGSEIIWFSSEDQIKSLPISNLRASDRASDISSPGVTRRNQSSDTFKSPSKDSLERIKSKDQPEQIVKILNFTNSFLIYLTDQGIIALYDKEKNQNKKLIEPLMQNFGGIKQCDSGKVLIFSKNGEIRSIEDKENTTALEATVSLPNNDLIQNSLTAIEQHGDLLISGDKYGNLNITGPSANGMTSLIYQTKAHSSNINEIVYFQVDKFQIITTISRDRMIQFFYSKIEDNKFDILQTIPVHNGNLLKVQYHENRIYVCSSDRTVSIHKIEIEDEELRITQDKLITTKTTPLAMKATGDELIVSTNEKSISVYQISESYALKRTLKLLNDKTNESLLVEDFIVLKNMLIVSCSDKSLRIFNYATGKQLSVTWGHLESIMGLILRSNNELISIGAEGCLLKWQLQDSQINETKNEEKILANETREEDIVPIYTKVTRKIIPIIAKPKINDIKSLLKGDCEDERSSPSSSPRLTAATLRRMESRKSMDSGVPTRKSVSPVRPL
ncbi:WD40 repeat-like protein, partial [Suhomyces tanzawaensis NRRL Y-17324]